MYFKWIQPIPNWLFIHFIQYFNKSVKKAKKNDLSPHPPPAHPLSRLFGYPKALGKWNFTGKNTMKINVFFHSMGICSQAFVNSCEECTHTHTNILLKNFPQRKCSTTINHFLQLPKLFFTLFQNRLHSISAQIQRQHHYPKNMKSMLL